MPTRTPRGDSEEKANKRQAGQNTASARAVAEADKQAAKITAERRGKEYKDIERRNKEREAVASANEQSRQYTDQQSLSEQRKGERNEGKQSRDPREEHRRGERGRPLTAAERSEIARKAARTRKARGSHR